VASLPFLQGAPVIPGRFCLESALMGKDLPRFGILISLQSEGAVGMAQDIKRQL
jgi:hypothetical protein